LHVEQAYAGPWLQVHDIDDRVAVVVALLKQHGFNSVVVQQPGALTGTDLYNLYAVRIQPHGV
jgi:hypothetical protein